MITALGGLTNDPDPSDDTPSPYDFSGAQGSPGKKAAPVPGPEWAAIIQLMSQMRMGCIFGKRSRGALVVCSASSGQFEWQTKHFPQKIDYRPLFSVFNP